MRIALALAALFSTTALAASNSGNYQAQAKKVEREAFSLKPGKYRFVNVKTKEGLKYVRAQQSIYAAKGKGDWMTVRKHEKHVVITPSASNSKCLSAAWSYSEGANAYAALYACRIKRSEVVEGDVIESEEDLQFLEFGDGKDRLDKREEEEAGMEKRAVPLRHDKQMFYLHPGPVNNCVHIVAYDHLKDQQTRVIVGSSGPPAWNKKIRYADIVKLDHNNPAHCWFVYNSKNQMVKF